MNFKSSARHSASEFIAWAAVVLVAAGIVVLLVNLDSQSYWEDELFSVYEANQSLPRLFELALVEVHTPLYALLLHSWVALGGTYETGWTRLLSVLLGITSIAVAYTSLRSARLSWEAWWLSVTATSVNGFFIVYALEARPYALLLLGSVGVTAVSLRSQRAFRDKQRLPWFSWMGWALLASTAHLFGALLVGVLATALAIIGLFSRRFVQVALLAGCGALAVAPQTAWLLLGINRPGFAGGTGWISAPGVKDVGVLLTTVFSAGDLTARTDGFAWLSPWGVVAILAILVVAVVLHFMAGTRVVKPEVYELRAAGFLLSCAGLTILAAFVVAQFVHIWTLRNLIAVAPPLLWGMVCLVCGLPGNAIGRQVVSAAVVVALAVSLVATAGELRRPYKTDFRAAMDYLIRARSDYPDATFVFLSDNSFLFLNNNSLLTRSLLSADRPENDPALRRIFRRRVVLPQKDSSIDLVRRLEGPKVVLYYTNVAERDVEKLNRRLVAELGDGCHRVSVYGLIMASCSVRR